jgi:excisionase family DNA binding protein
VYRLESDREKSATSARRVLVELSLVIVMQNETYNVYEAARQLGCTSSWIRVLLAEQRLAGAQKIEGQWRIPAAALDEMKQRQAVSA